MTMLFKAVGGLVQESHYGLLLARVIPLPPQVLNDATYFAHKLERRLQKKKKTSTNVVKERRRKLILDLKEHLVQAYNGALEGDLLASWLKELQKEFVNRMTAIDAEAEEASEVESTEGGDVDEGEEMRDRVVIEEDEYEDRPITQASQPSVVRADPRITSTESSSTGGASTTASSARAVSDNDY
jgi:DNA mismatch repair protein MSH4